MRTSVLFLVALVACNGGDGGTDTLVPEPTTTLATATSASSAPPPPFEEVTVELSEDGTFLIDSEGKSLYLFTLDTDRASSCESECAEAWPPLLGDPVAADGVDDALLGNAERGNGSIQVTYNGHPLYRYSGDERAGDTNGHGFNEVWFLVGPDGSPLDS